MTEVVVAPLTLAQARDLTDEVKADAATLWAKLLTLYEGKAHNALGYSSWEEYYAEEFGESGSRGWQLLTAARVVHAIEAAPAGELTNVSRPQTEAVARELGPILREDPEDVPEVWGEVVAEHGPTPTASEVREVVQRHVPPREANQQHKLVSGIVEKARLIVDLEPHLDLDAVKALPQEEREECKRQLSSARTVLSRLIGAL